MEQDTAVSRQQQSVATMERVGTVSLVNHRSLGGGNLDRVQERAEEVSEESQERSCLLGGEGCRPWSSASG